MYYPFSKMVEIIPIIKIRITKFKIATRSKSLEPKIFFLNNRFIEKVPGKTLRKATKKEWTMKKKSFHRKYEEHKSAGKNHKDSEGPRTWRSFIYFCRKKKNINNSTTCMGREREQAILKIQQL